MLKTLLFTVGCIATLLVQAHPVESPVALDTKSGTIAGTLTVPEVGQPSWVVLIVSGSGPTDRDGNSPWAKNDSLKMLARSLAESGIASVRYDKRGIGDSVAAGTAEDKLVFSTYVDDAVAWLAWLRSTERFRYVGVLGHSEGALTAMLVAKSTRPDAYISIAGLGRRASDVLRMQTTGKLPEELAKENEGILSSLEAGKLVETVSPPLQSLYRPSVQPYLISWFAHSPAQILSTISAPILLIQGMTDIQVNAQEFDILQQAAPKAMHIKIEGMNHILKMVDSDRAKQISSYSDPTLPISPLLGGTIARFLHGLNAKK